MTQQQRQRTTVAVAVAVAVAVEVAVEVAVAVEVEVEVEVAARMTHPLWMMGCCHRPQGGDAQVVIHLPTMCTREMSTSTSPRRPRCCWERWCRFDLWCCPPDCTMWITSRFAPPPPRAPTSFGLPETRG